MTTEQNPALEVVAWLYKTAHTTHLCHSRLDHYFSNDEGATYIKGESLIRQADHEAALLAKDAECEALRKDAERPTNAVLVPADKLRELQKEAARYKLLRRGQHWSVIDGMGYTLGAEKIDAAIDAAIRGASGQEGGT